MSKEKNTRANKRIEANKRNEERTLDTSSSNSRKYERVEKTYASSSFFAPSRSALSASWRSSAARTDCDAAYCALVSASYAGMAARTLVAALAPTELSSPAAASAASAERSASSKTTRRTVRGTR